MSRGYQDNDKHWHKPSGKEATGASGRGSHLHSLRDRGVLCNQRSPGKGATSAAQRQSLLLATLLLQHNNRPSTAMPVITTMCSWALRVRLPRAWQRAVLCSTVSSACAGRLEQLGRLSGQGWTRRKGSSLPSGARNENRRLGSPDC